jgi:predicted nucleic acid-binding protein
LTRTFLDAGVLIAAGRGNDPLSKKALEIIKDRERVFVSSPFVRLEILPKALFHQRKSEVVVYRSYFDLVRIWVNPNPGLLEEAEDVASRFGLSALDALHVTSSIIADADELVTTEGLSRPIHRVSGLAVRTIQA